MGSAVADSAKAGAIDQIGAGLHALAEAGGADPFDHADAIVMVRELEVLGRQVKALQVEIIAAIDRRGLHRVDGHASAKVMVRHLAHLSNPEAKRRAGAARALRDLPAVAAAFAAGKIGFCQADRIARAWANIRVRDRLCRQDRALANLAARETYERFDAVLSDWVRRSDEDGTCDRSQRNHQNRNAHLLQDFDGSWKFTAGSGSLQGAELSDIFKHFIDAEFASDWEQARLEHGDATTVNDLARTDAQRRHDAYFEIFQRAASHAPTDETHSNITTDVVIDQDTFERQLQRFAGVDLEPIDIDLEPQGRPDTYRCSTLDGRWVDPTEAVAAALVGHVRRVVVGSDSVVTNLGRRQRLFRGAAALAVRLSSSECYWPGCHVPVSDCQIDHQLSWADHSGGGSTDPVNGGPACGRHNRHKQRGYTVHRDRAGEWHTYRPDGTEIT